MPQSLPMEDTNMTDLELRSLSVRCPLCYAHKQSLCQGKAVPHTARIDEYQRQAKAKPDGKWPAGTWHQRRLAAVRIKQAEAELNS